MYLTHNYDNKIRDHNCGRIFEYSLLSVVIKCSDMLPNPNPESE